MKGIVACMITVNEAIKIALKHNPDYDFYVEYKDGYAFCRQGDEELDDASMVVLKKNGRLISMANFDYKYIIPGKDFSKKRKVVFR